jgi:hypothetical protein
MLTNKQWAELVQNANTHEKEIGRSYYPMLISECSVLRDENARLKEVILNVTERIEKMIAKQDLVVLEQAMDQFERAMEEVWK